MSYHFHTFKENTNSQIQDSHHQKLYVYNMLTIHILGSVEDEYLFPIPILILLRNKDDEFTRSKYDMWL